MNTVQLIHNITGYTGIAEEGVAIHSFFSTYAIRY